MKKSRQEGRGAALFLFLAAFFWSLSGILTKSVSFSGVELAVIRGLTACVVVAAVTRRIPRHLNKAKVLTAVCFFGQGLLFICANKDTTAANATVLQNTSPVYILLFTAIATKTLPRRRDVVTCLVLLFGIFLAFVGNLGGGGALGNMLALASALFYAGVYYCSRLPGADPVESVILGNGLYVLLLPLLLTSRTVLAADAADWGYAILFGVCSGAVAWLCFARGIRYVPPLRANFITMTEPIMAPIWTFLLLHETMSVPSLLGCGVVIVTLLVYNTLSVREQAR
ncbi:MAG: DMT family transporter [Oscillospiraceae bacterium]|nr:DMT family transporter [Oscillospiraceae bacterium]